MQNPNINVTYPPVPPTPEIYRSGEFEYIEDDAFRKYIKDAYCVISKNEWWGELKRALQIRGVNSSEGFMFTTDPLYNKIMNAIGSTEIGSLHSGFSISYCMRQMEQIALLGEPEYRQRMNSKTK
jgi:hypothetical protein